MNADKYVLFLVRSLLGNGLGIVVCLTLQPHACKCDLVQLLRACELFQQIWYAHFFSRTAKCVFIHMTTLQIK
jgi:hypothetical protein